MAYKGIKKTWNKKGKMLCHKDAGRSGNFWGLAVFMYEFHQGIFAELGQIEELLKYWHSPDK